MSDDVEADGIPITPHLFLPMGELQFRFDTSGGPGGQHANKAATRVTLIFNVVQSPALANAIGDAARRRLLARLGARLNSAGELHVVAGDSRSQHRNRATAVRRFQSLLADALRPPRPRRPTRPSAAARARRREAKKRKSQRKSERRWRFK